MAVSCRVTGGLQPAVARAIDLAHAAGTDGGQDLVRSEACAAFSATSFHSGAVYFPSASEGVAFYVGRVDEDMWFGFMRLGAATLHPLALMYAVSGSAMISATLRIPKP